MNCANCDSKHVTKKKVDFKLYGMSVGKFEAEVCSDCNEVIFDEAASSQMDAAAKEKGLWGLESRSKVAQSGDSLVIRVKKKLANFLGLKKGEEVTLTPDSKRKLIIEI